MVPYAQDRVPGVGAFFGQDIKESIYIGFKVVVTPQARKHGIQGQLWQRGYFDHIVRREEKLGQVAEYILNNPVRAGLVRDWAQYQFSGLPEELPGWW